MPHWNLDDETRDALTELINLGVSRAAASLSELVGQRIVLQVPNIYLYRPGDRTPPGLEELSRAATVINQVFEGSLQGAASLCFPADSSLALARLLSRDRDSSIDRLDAELSGILLEVGNIVLNGIMGSLSNSLLARLRYAMPEIRSIVRAGDELGPWDQLRADEALIGDVRFHVSEQQIEGAILLAFSLDSLPQLLDTLSVPTLA